jgi:predicted Zn-dependent protease
VHQFTIAGNYLGLLSSVEGIGDDIEFSPPSGASSVGSPSLLVGELAVSGA